MWGMMVFVLKVGRMKMDVSVGVPRKMLLLMVVLFLKGMEALL